jgi:hypothetical protein
VIDPANNDAILIITLRKKNEFELRLYPFVTYRTEEMFEAVLISSLAKGNEILMSNVSYCDTPIPALLAAAAIPSGRISLLIFESKFSVGCLQYSQYLNISADATQTTGSSFS